MLAEAHVQIAQHDNALVVPPSAVVRGEQGASVYVVQDEVATRTRVRTGLEQTDGVEILDGVREGQIVLTSSVYGLGEKAKLAK
jgi:multidrug efflux pump subunit AcrA (membrane-fusion protein)